MKLSTIWLLKGYPFRERLSRTRENLMSKLARALPKELKYYVLINEGVKHIEDTEVVPDVLFMDVLDRSGKSFR